LCWSPTFAFLTINRAVKVGAFDTQSTNMVRPLTEQPTIKFENFEGIFGKVNNSQTFVGTYFYQRPTTRVDSIYGSSGITPKNSNGTYEDTYEFTDLSAIGLGGPYKVGFFLTYQLKNGKRYCGATLSGQEFYVNPVLYVIYSSWVVWTGVGLFLGSFFFIVLFSCFCFKHKRKWYACCTFGKTFQNEYGTSLNYF
jgi:hypothetical protein